ncbi:MAG: hypothetical protein KF742_01770 [Cryobacterium sp.]|nr:hypothetical protein [Cryobacterium sp.]
MSRSESSEEEARRAVRYLKGISEESVPDGFKMLPRDYDARKDQEYTVVRLVKRCLDHSLQDDRHEKHPAVDTRVWLLTYALLCKFPRSPERVRRIIWSLQAPRSVKWTIGQLAFARAAEWAAQDFSRDAPARAASMASLLRKVFEEEDVRSCEIDVDGICPWMNLIYRIALLASQNNHHFVRCLARELASDLDRGGAEYLMYFFDFQLREHPAEVPVFTANIWQAFEQENVRRELERVRSLLSSLPAARQRDTRDAPPRAPEQAPPAHLAPPVEWRRDPVGPLRHTQPRPNRPIPPMPVQAGPNRFAPPAGQYRDPVGPLRHTPPGPNQPSPPDASLASLRLG